MKSLEELKAIRERMQGEIGVRKADANETRVVVGMPPAALPAAPGRYSTAWRSWCGKRD